MLFTEPAMLQVVEAAARRALAAEHAQLEALQAQGRSATRPALDEAAPSTSGMLVSNNKSCLHLPAELGMCRASLSRRVGLF